MGSLGRLAAVATLSIALAQHPPLAVTPTCVPADQCCKICEKGQACGDSCISRAKTCRKGRGCACDAAEICP